MSLDQTNASNVVQLVPSQDQILADRVRKMIQDGREIANTLELDVIIGNFGDIVDRIQRLSPQAHAVMLDKVFNGNRSTLSKLSNPEARDRRKKLKTFLDKIEAIGSCVSELIEYPSNKMVLDLIRKTDIASEIQYSSTSIMDRAIDDLWELILQTAHYIDRKTGIYEKLEFMRSHSFQVAWDFDNNTLVSIHAPASADDWWLDSDDEVEFRDADTRSLYPFRFDFFTVESWANVDLKYTTDKELISAIIIADL